MAIQHTKWAQTTRLFREVVVTEKLDGSNFGIIFQPAEGDFTDHRVPWSVLGVNGETVEFGAQSRNNLITPEKDAFGFAFWVWDNALELFQTLGYGLHMGEFWGAGIQRGYGLQKGDRRFSLFNTKGWDETLGGDNAKTVGGVGISTVPTLYKGLFSEDTVREEAELLQAIGSKAAPGFMNPEGVCVFFTQSRQVMKYTPYHGNDGHKTAKGSK